MIIVMTLHLACFFLRWVMSFTPLPSLKCIHLSRQHPGFALFLGDSLLGPQSLCREAEGVRAKGDPPCCQRGFPMGAGPVELSRPGCAHQAQLQVEPDWEWSMWWLLLAFLCVCYPQPRPSMVSTGM